MTYAANTAAASHWLVRLVRTLGVTLADLDASAGAAEAWTHICEHSELTERELSKAVADQFRLELADLEALEPTAMKLVPESLARRYGVVPLGETDRTIVLATSDPTDSAAEQALGFAAGRDPVLKVASPSQIAGALDRHYAPSKIMNDILSTIKAPETIDTVRVVEAPNIDEDAAADVHAAPVVKLTNLILHTAISERASDIHFEPGRNGGVVRFRVDGVLRRHMQLPLPALVRVVSRIKVIAQLDIADRIRPQDGRARLEVEGRAYDLRVSTVPTRDAEKAVIRVLDSAGTVGLGEVGIDSYDLERLRACLGHRDGIVIVTGPTGSGKTTTLYGAIHDLATDEVNVMTVEDPVEYELAGVTQIQVERKRGVTFASALRAILRQDPDVVFVGEIRDQETAEIAVQASSTGHLVLATLHTNDAASAVQRLVDLGLDRPSIAGSLRAVLSQRLVRRLCQDCAASPPAAPDEASTRLAERHGLRPARVPQGCPVCGQSGYRGRMPLTELLVVDADIAALIVAGATRAEIEQAGREAGMRLLAESAREPVEGGLTSLDEVERVLGERSARPAGSTDDPAHVLLVDDDAVNRTLARKLLEKNGYRVSEAPDGAVALERLRSGGDDYALMVLDLDMPLVGGREVLGEVRGSLTTAGLPVVVLTGTQDADAEVQLMEAGADDYIRKPIDPPRFVTRVRAALRRAGG